ncbi:hypothetical protein OCU04_002446 [Sclerotinia nivalis]|uniref:O-methyltransferase domain-containing protein n=1 Tax=Sclerotinia nivalis TaxID=352851 RepID=A0A9X0DMK7_9HELO|nr:hypothetical protein OCU04_002446 [Sclerotinia nivalis]
MPPATMPPATTSMEEIFQQFSNTAGSADDVTKKDLMVRLRRMADSLEDADDTVNRLIHLSLELAVVRVGVDLKIYDLLVAHKTPMSVNAIAKDSGASPQLLGRLLRFLSSHGAIKESGKDEFTFTNVTQNLVATGSQAGICHNFATVCPQYQDLPAFLRKTEYQDITDPAHTVMQDTFNFEGKAFDWMGSHPENLAYFNDYMAGRRHNLDDTWLSVYPVEAEVKDWDPEAPVYVDVGGSVGHQCAGFKLRYPNLPGRVILQDLPHTIAAARLTPGVQNMAHDFFEPQPIKGAKFYYMRAVLHDWPDDLARKIIHNIKLAMGEDSVLLVDEMVLPDVGVYSHVTSIDLSMMCALASVERTESQWEALFASEGLELVQAMSYKPTSYESIMKFVQV